MTQSPKVTIAIPVYNGSNYLSQAIESALAQTYDNKEIIVVNDGSCDDGKTDAICRSFLPDIIYCTQNNQGVGAALNRVIKEMSGEIFTWLSHDDIHLPHKIEKQVEYYKKLQLKDAVIFSDSYFIDDGGKIIGETCLPFKKYIESPQRVLLDGAINGCTIFIPVCLIRNNGGFDENLRFTQDYDMWNKIISQHDFYLLPEILVKYRLHQNQDTHDIRATREADKLWINICQSKTETQKALISGSSYLYYSELEHFLAQTPYLGAYEYVKSLSDVVHRDCLVSIIFRCDELSDVAGIKRAVESLGRQTHFSIEVVALISEELASHYITICTQFEQLKTVNIILSPVIDDRVLIRGLHSSSGSYICFIDAKSFFNDVKIEKQANALLMSGSMVSCNGFSLVDGNNLLIADDMEYICGYIASNEEIELSTLMVHRRVIAAGHFEGVVLQGSKIKFPQKLETYFQINIIDACLTYVSEIRE